jgi:hypothetical protein
MAKVLAQDGASASGIPENSGPDPPMDVNKSSAKHTPSEESNINDWYPYGYGQGDYSGFNPTPTPQDSTIPLHSLIFQAANSVHNKDILATLGVLENQNSRILTHLQLQLDLIKHLKDMIDSN